MDKRKDGGAVTLSKGNLIETDSVGYIYKSHWKDMAELDGEYQLCDAIVKNF